MRQAAFAIAGGLVVAVLALGLYSAVAVRQAESEYPAVGALVSVEGAPLHYVRRGAGQPVVFLHGSDGVLQDALTTVFDAVAADHDALAVDRPGHGYSGRPADEPLTLALNARMLRGGLAALGVERPALVGHSYGGAVALQYALDYPEHVAGLVLLAPAASPLDSPTSPRVTLPAVPVLGGLYLRTLLQPIQRRAPAPTDADVRSGQAPAPAYQAALRALGARPAQHAAYAEEMRHVSHDLAGLAPRYREITVPAVIVAGAADAVTPLGRHAEPLAGALPRARLVVLANTGHWVHHADPAAALIAIRDLLASPHPPVGETRAGE